MQNENENQGKNEPTFKIMVDQKPIDWPKPTINGAEIKTLAKVDASTYEVWQDVPGPEDIPVADDQDVDLTGWVVMDSDPTHVFLFDNGPVLPADSFLVVCRTLSDFQTFYPNLPYVAGDLGFGLGSTDDTVRLYHPDGSRSGE